MGGVATMNGADVEKREETMVHWENDSGYRCRRAKEMKPRFSSGKRMLIWAPFAVVMFAATPLFAAEGYVRAGAAGIFYNPSTTVHSGGGTVPGAESSIDPNYTLAIDLGIYPFEGHGLLDGLAFSLGLGLPLKANVEGAGSFEGAGTIAKSTYGPAVLAAHYHLRSVPYVKPYLGVGLTYAIIFDTEDGAMTDASVDPAFGAVFVGGFDVPLGDRFGLFADAKLVRLSVTANGNIGGMATTSDLTLNPVVVTIGASARF